jgi:hypothetical protein
MLAVMPWVASRCWTASRRTGCRDPSGAGALPWVSGSPATWRGHARSNPQSTGGPLPSRSRGASTGRAPRRGRVSPPSSRRRDVSGPHPVRLRDLELPGEGVDGPRPHVARVGRGPPLLHGRGPDSLDAHESRNAILTDSVAPRGIAGVLAAHGAGRAPRDRYHRPQRMAAGQGQAQGFTSFSTHVSIGSLCHGNTVAQQGLSCCTWS